MVVYHDHLKIDEDTLPELACFYIIVKVQSNDRYVNEFRHYLTDQTNAIENDSA